MNIVDFIQQSTTPEKIQQEDQRIVQHENGSNDHLKKKDSIFLVQNMETMQEMDKQKNRLHEQQIQKDK